MPSESAAAPGVTHTWRLVAAASNELFIAEGRISALRFMLDHLLWDKAESDLSEAAMSALADIEQAVHTAKLKTNAAQSTA